MIYWCKKCKTPIFEKGLHSCSCDGKITKISESSICNPVFKQEKKLLEKIMDCSLGNEIIWYLGASKYLINEKIVKIPYREWYKQKKHLAIAEELRGDIEVERDYSPYMAVVSANEKYLNTEIYHPDDMQRWKNMVYEFAERTGKTDPDDYYEEGRWRTNVSIANIV